VEYEAWVDYAAAGERYVHAEYMPDRRDEGRVSGVHVLVSDISERRRNEEAVEQLSRERRSQLAEMQALFDAAPIGIFIARDVECHEMDMNSAGARMLRLGQDVNPSLTGPEAPALPFRVYRDGREMRPEELPMQRAARQGERIDPFEASVHFRDGEVKTLILCAAPLQDASGEVHGCVGTFADITELRAAETRYREAMERLALHLDNTPVAALEWGADMRILRWSPAAERIFGWRKEETLGQTLDALGFVHPDDRAAVADRMASMLRGDVCQNRNLNRNLRKDGRVIWCEWYNSVLRDDKGGLVSVLSLAMDVSDRQRLESDLREQADQLRQLDRRKDEFLSMLGHELRNPLAPVRNALAVMDVAGDDPERMAWACDLINRQTMHLERLVDDLLDTARITRGAVQLKTEPLDLRAVLRESVEAAERLVRARQHDLNLELPEAPVFVTGDNTRLVQIVTNLINNAAKYSAPQGSIRVSLVCDGATARIAVEDNGRGIAAKDLAIIFDVFSQGRQSLARAEGGLGLGLPLVRKLAELHGGSVEAQSGGEGQGSRFVVCLPISQHGEARVLAAEQPKQAEHEASGEDKRRRIVLADDNPDVLESLTLFFQALGHEVWQASTGEPVAELVQRVQPDVVILDIGLPDIDGMEVARRLAALPCRRSMKVIALSGYVEQVGGSGLFDAHVLKGTDSKLLAQMLD
jgi:PAS domain S-box-containing protein